MSKDELTPARLVPFRDVVNHWFHEDKGCLRCGARRADVSEEDRAAALKMGVVMWIGPVACPARRPVVHGEQVKPMDENAAVQHWRDAAEFWRAAALDARALLKEALAALSRLRERPADAPRETR